MQWLKNQNKFLSIYLAATFVLALTSVNFLFNSNCNFYSDYLTCSYQPSNLTKWANFFYLASIFLLLSFSYYKILKNKLKVSFYFVLTIIFLFFLTVPFGSTDIFYYRGVAKGEIELNINPYKGGFYKDIKFLNQPTGALKAAMYPPTWLQYNKILYSLSPINECMSMYIYKFSSLIAILLTYFIIKKNYKAQLANIFVLNPLILFEFVTNAHLDVYLTLLTVLSIVFLTKNKISRSAISLFAASMVKFTAVLPLAFYHIYNFLKKSNWKSRFNAIFLFLTTTSVGIIFIVLNYKPYWFGPKTLDGISKQSDWPFNTIFERLVFTKLNPALYFFNGKYNAQSFRDIWLILVFIGLLILGTHIIKNLNLKSKKDILDVLKLNFSITKNSAIFYSGFLLLIFPTIMMRSFLPWYLIWSTTYFIFSKFKYKYEVIGIQTLILAIYYPAVYLMGHFNVSTGLPIYNYLVGAEIILTISTLYMLFISKIKVIN